MHGIALFLFRVLFISVEHLMYMFFLQWGYHISDQFSNPVVTESVISHLVRPSIVTMFPFTSLLGAQYSGLELGQSFLSVAPVLPTAPSGDDGSNVEVRFFIF